jgi:hypothetical protein
MQNDFRFNFYGTKRPKEEKAKSPEMASSLLAFEPSSPEKP